MGIGNKIKAYKPKESSNELSFGARITVLVKPNPFQKGIRVDLR